MSKFRLFKWRINMIIHKIRYKIDKKYKIAHDEYMKHLQYETIENFDLVPNESAISLSAEEREDI